MKEYRSLSIRLDDGLREKLRFIAAYEGRSANSQILYLIRKNIMEFEKEHGEIPNA